MTVRIHWRRRHITDNRLAALRDVLAAHPGDDEVLVSITGISATVRLPVKVDGTVRSLRGDIHRATEGACAVVEGLEPAW